MARIVRKKPVRPEAAEPDTSELVRAVDDLNQIVPQALRTMREFDETLLFARQSFGEALLRLPKAEDYEPIAAPLREFAKVAPAFIEALQGVVAATTGRTSGDGRGTAAAPSAGARADAAASSNPTATSAPGAVSPSSSPSASSAPPTSSDDVRVAAAVSRIDAAREAVLEALASLPRESDYTPVASQLRELASVSPSLMEWLAEVPRLATPLADSVLALRQAAEDLKTARSLLKEG